MNFVNSVVSFLLLTSHVVYSKQLTSASRIIGGEPVPPDRYPFFTFVLTEVINGSIPCGGSLIYSDIILTAASCIPPANDEINVAINITNFDDPSRGFTSTVRRFIRHPEFNDGNLRNDIALLKIGTIFESDYHFAKYNIIKNIPVTGEEVKVLGFGSISEVPFEPSRTLQEVKVEIIDFDKCNQAYQNGLDEQTQICAGSVKGGKDSCLGDSGGPLMNIDDIVVGIVSGGNGCGRVGFPGFYTNVSAYSKFIEDSVCVLTESNPLICQTEIPTFAPSHEPSFTNSPTNAFLTTKPSFIPSSYPVTMIHSSSPTESVVTVIPSSPIISPTKAPVTFIPSFTATDAPVTFVPSFNATDAPVTLIPPPTATDAPVNYISSSTPTHQIVSPIPFPTQTDAPVISVLSASPSNATVTSVPSHIPTNIRVSSVPSSTRTITSLSSVPSSTPKDVPVTTIPSINATVTPITANPSISPTNIPVTINSSSIPTGSIILSESPSSALTNPLNEPSDKPYTQEPSSTTDTPITTVAPAIPSSNQTDNPVTASPTFYPTSYPSTAIPSSTISDGPVTVYPIISPSPVEVVPVTVNPTTPASSIPTTLAPITTAPIIFETKAPTSFSTITSNPTSVQTVAPAPNSYPTRPVTSAPIEMISALPSNLYTIVPSENTLDTNLPTILPFLHPSNDPSVNFSKIPSDHPSLASVSNSPSKEPSSVAPTEAPNEISLAPQINKPSAIIRGDDDDDNDEDSKNIHQNTKSTRIGNASNNDGVVVSGSLILRQGDDKDDKKTKKIQSKNGKKGVVKKEKKAKNIHNTKKDKLKVDIHDKKGGKIPN
eukprot:CAMPEP_0194177210 /NCGR_PEP_ID=MMETSP0154-20130528/11012_1 /TAXON_ID=1049557 /ORGANISM="Thalassiothrix antarctica, Strain L6-D1" /LENGTH=827 /DNA_ID=CAMNT_0038891711 /DNA_START=47 /DNA_END=2530 /DNA_ORIENTATION=+